MRSLKRDMKLGTGSSLPGWNKDVPIHWKVKSMYESQAEGSAPYSSFWWFLSREWHNDDGARERLYPHTRQMTHGGREERVRGFAESLRSE